MIWSLDTLKRRQEGNAAAGSRHAVLIDRLNLLGSKARMWLSHDAVGQQVGAEWPPVSVTGPDGLWGPGVGFKPIAPPFRQNVTYLAFPAGSNPLPACLARR
ncbi:hypothetical protein chiPu_0029829 [Chiloscyllium punctatum]|uniref:Uncharacterized protein n=1 Tax=Chiloscyllium punctatum TaxID=137246 RepID=A0A401TSN1_CHIPU|nr:hypothetical protein [Chiloscyllium punctatum]